MKRIKKFESFNTTHREPTKVSEDEWKKKSNMYSDEKFNRKEVDFFKKLKDSKVTDISLLATGAIIMKFGMVWIHFYKKSDDWYLICVETNRFQFQEVTDGDEYYICDEWDEVLGYLENINLI
jgi:hypothetical protein